MKRKHTMFIPLEGVHGVWKPHELDEDLQGLVGQQAYAEVSRADYDKIMDVSKVWYRTPEDYVFKKIKGADGKWNMQYMHHVVVAKPDQGVVHHENGRRYDNTAENLLGTDYGHNNADRLSRGQSGYKGVYINRYGTYTAQKQWQGYLHYLGTFGTAEEASRAYQDFSGTVGHPIHQSKVRQHNSKHK